MAKTKGAKNKRSFEALELVQRMDVDPLERLLLIGFNRWKEIGLPTEFKTSFTSAGIEYEEPWISIRDQVTALKAACEYVHPKKANVQLSNDEGKGFKIVVEDYSKE